MNPVLKEKRVAVIGCGGLGNNVLAHLVGEGVGTVLFCDGDKVEESNLDRQFLFSRADIGRKKTDAVKDFFTRYAPEIEAIPVTKRVRTPEDPDFAKDCDALVLAVDNVKTRRLVSDFCALHSLPLALAGVSGRYGNAYLWLPGKTPCPACAGLLGKDASLPAPSSSVGLVGALLSELTLRFLSGDENKAGRLFVYDGAEIGSLLIRSRRDCPVCGENKK